MSTSFGARVGTVEPGDEDHFSVHASGGEQLFFGLMSQSDLVVEVQGNGGTRLLMVDSAFTGSPAGPAGEAANLTLPGPGRYVLKVRGIGMAGDLPIPGDYDGDRRSDLAVYRRTAGDWFIRFARGGAATVRWGAPWLDDIPVPADYDGDGTTDVAVYRNATGEWFVAYSSGGLGYTGWGAPWLGDIPVPGDTTETASRTSPSIENPLPGGSYATPAAAVRLLALP